MNNPIYCSTGTVIGRANYYDYRLIPRLAERINADAFELMMLTAWYPRLETVAAYLRDSGVRFAVMHSDKDIGTHLSFGEDDDAMRKYRLCVRTAAAVGAEKLVLHLWGGRGSDTDFDHNLSFCPEMRRIAADSGILLVVENVPCSAGDPLSHWESLAARDPEQRYIFDTRFGDFHGQLFSAAREWFLGPRLPLIKHMHISDYLGPQHDFRSLRPIVHPGEGIIDFASFFSYAAPVYHDSITLESPVLAEDGTTDIDKLNKTLDYLRRMTAGKDKA